MLYDWLCHSGSFHRGFFHSVPVKVLFPHCPLLHQGHCGINVGNPQKSIETLNYTLLLQVCKSLNSALYWVSISDQSCCSVQLSHYLHDRREEERDFKKKNRQSDIFKLSTAHIDVYHLKRVVESPESDRGLVKSPCFKSLEKPCLTVVGRCSNKSTKAETGIFCWFKIRMISCCTEPAYYHSFDSFET